MREHFINDSVITLEDIRKAEKLLNNHARSWVRIFNIGDSIGQMKRCTRALMSNYVMIPSLQGLCKRPQAQLWWDPILEPKMRPLCAANQAPNAAFSNLVSMASRAIGDSIANTSGKVISSEEVKRKLEELNKEHKLVNPRENLNRSGKAVPVQNHSNIMVYSMDVQALYPSIERHMASQTIKESVRASKLERC